ncbi:MAG: hypothetical protein GY773_15295, partial [Actinomycetia bacterium]|nr:hypothetical protein [Actinomycetes bacterium]
MHTIAIGRNPRADYEQLFLEYGRFRGWIYTAVKDIMPSDQLGVGGVDFDRYDDYSAHLAAIEIVATDGVIEKKVVGASRLIIDIGDEAHPYVTAGLEPGLGLLPVEDHFPELASPVDLRDDRVRCEVSRYAALHRRPSMQRRITLALRRGITAHFINASGQQAYAVVERPL